MASALNLRKRSSLSLKKELLIGFGGVLLMTFLTIVGSYLNMHRMHVQVSAFAQESGRMRELSLLIENDFLVARQGEAGFLGSWQLLGFDTATLIYIDESHSRLNLARERLSQLETLVQSTDDRSLRSLSDDIVRLSSLLDAYEETLDEMVSLVELRSRSTGPEQRLLSHWKRLEATVEPLADQRFVYLVWQLRINEEAYFSTGRQEYIDNVRLLVDKFSSLVKSSSDATLTVEGHVLSRSGLVAQVQDFYHLFDTLVELDRKIENDAIISEDTTEEIRTIAVHILEVSAQSADAAREQLEAIHRQNVVAIVLLTVVVVGIGYVVGVWVNERVMQPLSRLGEAARRIGQGDFSHEIPTYGEDELDTLARAFNTMSERLRETLEGLEQQVAERTAELERHTERLQTAAEITRDVSTADNLNDLLDRAVALLEQRFGFYHVSVFLLDDERQTVSLMSAAGAGAEQLIAQGLYVQVGVGAIGYVAATGMPYIVTGTEQDEPYIPHPLLTAARSEVAIPLRVGQEIIGVLLLQSETPASFGERDVVVFRTLADQLAVAIQNVRLVQEMEQTLHELEVASGRYTREAWEAFVQRFRRTRGYRYRKPRLEIVTGQHEEAVEALRAGRTVVTTFEATVEAAEEKAVSALAVPIKLRGQVIGVLDIHFEGETPPDAISLVEEAASRMALALESARLFEEAQARAAREQTIRHITERIRRSVEVEAILKTAIISLGEAVGAPRIYVRMGTEAELLSRSTPDAEPPTSAPSGR